MSLKRLAVFGLLILGAARGASADDLCGATIIGDLKLEHDLLCAGDGLIAGADGIRIDLNGHTIAGSGVGVGILVTGLSDVTIAGGVIRDFGVAVRLNGSIGSVVRHGEFVSNREAIDVGMGSIGTTIKENTFQGSATRAVMLRGNTRDSDVKNNTFTGNRIGILVFGALDSQLKDNLISESTLAGIRVNVFAQGNVIKGNTVAFNTAGIEFLITPTGSAVGNELKSNTLTGNACGLKGPTAGNTLKDNMFDGNGSDLCP